MEFELEIIKINKDVITTSVTCSNVHGFAATTGFGWYCYLNGSSDYYSLSDTNQLDPKKIYHVDEQGNILTDVCECSDFD